MMMDHYGQQYVEGNFSDNDTFDYDYNSSTATTELKPHHPMLAVILSCFALATTFGNSLVILAVCRERQLRTVTNCFIVSLACADLLIGVLVMPFAIVYEVNKGVWYLGPVMCDIWHMCDVLASTASILNLCVISLDRYWAVTFPLTYSRTKMTYSRAGFLVGLVWLCSAGISVPCVLFWWKAVDSPSGPLECLFTSDVPYSIISACVSFYIPSVVMVFTYVNIYRKAENQLERIRTGTRKVCTGANGKSSESMGVHRGGQKSQRLPSTPKPGSGLAKVTKLAKEYKAVKILWYVFGVFIICWLPFFVANNFLWTLCKDSCVSHPEIVLPIVTWLGWLNSIFNPVIYACSSRKFKRAFGNILLCRRTAYFRRRSKHDTGSTYMMQKSFSENSMVEKKTLSRSDECFTGEQ